MLRCRTAHLPGVYDTHTRTRTHLHATRRRGVLGFVVCLPPGGVKQRHLQLQELEDFKRDGIQKLDSMERVTSAASKDAQNYEAQIQGLHRQLKEAQAAIRVFEQDSDKVSESLPYCPGTA